MDLLGGPPSLNLGSQLTLIIESLQAPPILNLELRCVE